MLESLGFEKSSRNPDPEVWRQNTIYLHSFCGMGEAALVIIFVPVNKHLSLCCVNIAPNASGSDVRARNPVSVTNSLTFFFHYER
ncbi:hypothetical protein BaRGS_00011902 [Batillaria attramentaria]|uniref:Uncharacterized protein n=1 Tax=Batillaria attramentaria TaxID=370345 RepID=A0ABD0LBJ1_9CAEN